jgi:1-aminocyclopropane-1-carboxylate deaminase/D-cysteine desulfhydrase-like pyridoxal-dependent ACC family enzyme
MTKNIFIQDFDCFPFFQNVVQSKLTEAQQHLKKIEVYKSNPEVSNLYMIDEYARIHEEQNDFITLVYNQCHTWLDQSLLQGQFDKIKQLEMITRKLETIIYHILFIIEQIQRSKKTPEKEDSYADALCGG